MPPATIRFKVADVALLLTVSGGGVAFGHTPVSTELPGTQGKIV